MTRLYLNLLVRLMPREWLDAISDLYEEQLERLHSESQTITYSQIPSPLERATAVVGDLLDTARCAGWRSWDDELEECFRKASGSDQ